MPRSHDDDPLRPRPRQRKPGETKAQAETRVREELRALIADERYRRGDPEFRNHVRRQHQRVFNDPSGKRSSQVVGGPQVYSTDIEPFDPSRGRGHETGPRNASSRRSSKVSIRTAASRKDGDLLPTDNRPLNWNDFGGRQHGPSPEQLRDRKLDIGKRVQRTLDAVDAMIAAGQREGLSLAATFLQRYRDGEGGVVHLSWPTIRSYRAAREAEKRIRTHYDNWFLGAQEIDLGWPFLALADGETMTVGTPNPSGSLVFGGEWSPVLLSAERRTLDFSLAFGEAEIKGHGQINFSRSGNTIHVDGTVDMRFDETYDFESGALGIVASLLTRDAPVVTNEDLRLLATYGPAQPFRAVAQRPWRVVGEIVLMDGRPDAQRSWFTWKELSRHHGSI